MTDKSDKWDSDEKKRDFPNLQPGQVDLDDNRIGFLENETKFRDTIKVYERILEKELALSISGNMPFMPRTDDKMIYMPKSLPGVAQTERDLYVLMEQQLAKHIAKSDGRNAVEFIKKAKDKSKDENGADIEKPTFYGYEHSAYLIYNIAEMARVESYLAEIFKGTGFELKGILRRFVKQPPQNVLEVLWAVKCRRMDLIPPEFQQLADEYMLQLQKLENCAPEATYPVTKTIFKMIQDELNPDQYVLMPPGSGGSNNDPFAPKVKMKGQKGGKGKGQKQKSEEGGGEEENDGESGESDNVIDEEDLEPIEGEGESEGKEEEGEGSNETGDSGKSGDSQDSDTQQQGGGAGGQKNENDMQKQMEKMAEDFVKNNPLTNKMNEPDIIETEKTDYDPEDERTDEEIIEDAQEQGEEDLEELKEKLAEAISKIDDLLGAEEDKGIYTHRTDEKGQRVIDKDNFGTIKNTYDPNQPHYHGIYTEFDHAAVRQLRELFRRIKGKTNFFKADEGTHILIDGYIQRRAGNAEAKVFEKKMQSKGLNVAYCIDLSSSMSNLVRFRSTSIMKFNAVKHILHTLHEATHGIDGVNLMMFAFADEYSDYIEVPKITRKRLENIEMGGGTATHGAVRMATEELMKCKGKKVIVILTDGAPNNQEQTTVEIEFARKAGITVYTVIVEPIKKNHMEYMVTHYARIFGKPNKEFTVILNMADAGRILINMMAKNVVALLMGRM